MARRRPDHRLPPHTQREARPLGQPGPVQPDHAGDWTGDRVPPARLTQTRHLPREVRGNIITPIINQSRSRESNSIILTQGLITDHAN